MSIFGIYFLSTQAGLLVFGVIVIAVLYVRAITAAHRYLDSLGSRVIETACGAIEYARIEVGYSVLMVHGAFGGFDRRSAQVEPGRRIPGSRRTGAAHQRVAGIPAGLENRKQVG
jgi:hypothetical protein